MAFTTREITPTITYLARTKRKKGVLYEFETETIAVNNTGWLKVSKFPYQGIVRQVEFEIAGEITVAKLDLWMGFGMAGTGTDPTSLYVIPVLGPDLNLSAAAGMQKSTGVKGIDFPYRCSDGILYVYVAHPADGGASTGVMKWRVWVDPIDDEYVSNIESKPQSLHIVAMARHVILDKMYDLVYVTVGDGLTKSIFLPPARLCKGLILFARNDDGTSTITVAPAAGDAILGVAGTLAKVNYLALVSDGKSQWFPAGAGIMA